MTKSHACRNSLLYYSAHLVILRIHLPHFLPVLYFVIVILSFTNIYLSCYNFLMFSCLSSGMNRSRQCPATAGQRATPPRPPPPDTRRLGQGGQGPSRRAPLWWGEGGQGTTSHPTRGPSWGAHPFPAATMSEKCPSSKVGLLHANWNSLFLHFCNSRFPLFSTHLRASHFNISSLMISNELQGMKINWGKGYIFAC